MMIRHSLVVAAMLAGTLVAGCSTNFDAMNTAFQSVKTTSGAFKNSNMVGAAIATNMAAVELMSTLAGGGKSGVVAPGGANYSILATTEEGESDLKSDVKDQNGNPVVTGHYKYKLTKDGDTLKYELSEFTGAASGYTFKDVTGHFNFVPVAGAAPVNGLVPAQVEAALVGKVDSGSETMALDLGFDVKNPLPDNAEKFAHIKMTSATVGYEATVSTRGGDFVMELRDKDGNLLNTTTAKKDGTIVSNGATK